MAFANFRLSRYVFPPSANGLAKFVPTLNGVWNYAYKENGFPANKSNSASINMNSPTSDYFINYSCKRNDFLANKSNNTSINMNTPKSDYLIQKTLLRRTSPTFPRGSFAKGFQKTDLNSSKLAGGIFDERYVLSCCIHTGRSIRGFSLPSRCSRNDRRDVESIVRHALSGLEGGRYNKLTSLPETERHNLIDDHFLWKKPLYAKLRCSNLVGDWADGRGIWHNEDKNFLVWVNEEDHARLVSMEAGGDMRAVFDRFCSGLKKFQKGIERQGHKFKWNEHLGFGALTYPANLGIGLRAGVHLKLVHLSQDSRFEDILQRLGLQKRGTAVENVFDISPSDRLGFSEVEIVQRLIDGVNLLINMEKRLERSH